MSETQNQQLDQEQEQQGGEPSPEQALEEAKRQLAQQKSEQEAARQRWVEAERERDQAIAMAQHAQGQVTSAQETAVEQQLRSQEHIARSAESEYRRAIEAGDYEAATKAQRDLSQAHYQINRLGETKEHFARLKQQPQQPQQPQPRQQQPQPRQNDAAQEWLNSHPRFTSDPAYRSAASGAHHAAVSDGIVEGSPAYFRFLNEQMDRYERFEKFQNGDAGDPPQRAAPRAPASSTALPPSRSSPAGSTPRGGASAAQVARQMGVTEDDLRHFASVSNMSFADYVKDQAAVMEDQRAGRSTGLIYGEQNYR